MGLCGGRSTVPGGERGSDGSEDDGAPHMMGVWRGRRWDLGGGTGPAQAKASVVYPTVMGSSLEFLDIISFVLLLTCSTKQCGEWAIAGEWHQMEDFTIVWTSLTPFLSLSSPGNRVCNYALSNPSGDHSRILPLVDPACLLWLLLHWFNLCFSSLSSGQHSVSGEEKKIREISLTSAFISSVHLVHAQKIALVNCFYFSLSLFSLSLPKFLWFPHLFWC